MFILFCMIFIKISSQQQNVWNYPQRPGMESWKQLQTAEERINACQVPKDILVNLKTSELIKICLDYPLFKDLYFANSVVTGFKAMISNSNSFQELLSRSGAAKILLDLYNNMEVTLPSELKNPIDIGAYTFEFVKVELFLSNQQIFKYFDETDLALLKQILIKNYGKKAKSQTEYGLPFGLIPTSLIIARILDNQDDSTLSSNDKVLIKSFIITGVPADSEFLERIYEAIKR
jgi:hypothetical protein